MAGASDEEIMALMAEVGRLERRAERAVRALTDARRNLAIRAMSRMNDDERERMYASGQTITTESILYWAAREAEFTSRVQRRQWRLFREIPD